MVINLLHWEIYLMNKKDNKEFKLIVICIKQSEPIQLQQQQNVYKNQSIEKKLLENLKQPIQNIKKIQKIKNKAIKFKIYINQQKKLKNKLSEQQKHPQINAVSTGAIFSTYQKLRVQNVCKRLGMTSLAYLWERQQTALLQQMIDYPLNAIIIKIASYGLKFTHLNKTITQLQPTFMKLKQQCGMNVCGQGGQFQSLVLDCPLFVKKIVLDQTQIIITEKNQIAPVGYLMIKKFHLQDKLNH